MRKTTNKIEAAKAVLDGCKVYCSAWSESAYLTFNGTYIIDEGHERYGLNETIFSEQPGATFTIYKPNEDVTSEETPKEKEPEPTPEPAKLESVVFFVSSESDAGHKSHTMQRAETSNATVEFMEWIQDYTQRKKKEWNSNLVILNAKIIR